ncbi:hypothetical protein KSP39_PZI018995 [Platanthera zijinensis]|uniref:Ubiquitin-like protease family profile domain-containing protein n=1 Tax=Platanthera zijinensis TaxID=2320716 RepID=A0AAP0B3Q6_9ASPA
MAGHCTGTYLNSRCAISTFKKYAEPILELLSEHSLDLLREAGLLQLFSIPGVPKNIPILYRLLRLYRPDKAAFLLGQYYIKFTVNKVALILGLPNRGDDFHFHRAPYSEVKQSDIVAELNQLANEAESEDLEQRRVDALVKFSLTKFFLPLKSLTIPECLQQIGGLEDFRRYNWAKTIHGFLNAQLTPLHNLSCSREEPSSLGYLEGCSIILVDNMDDWPTTMVNVAPTQNNVDDCGVFVMKYMEKIASREVICWSKHKDWQIQMSAFRAQIACDLIRCFLVAGKE